MKVYDVMDVLKNSLRTLTDSNLKLSSVCFSSLFVEEIIKVYEKQQAEIEKLRKLSKNLKIANSVSFSNGFKMGAVQEREILADLIKREIKGEYFKKIIDEIVNGRKDEDEDEDE